MDFKDLVYIRYDIRPDPPPANPTELARRATGRDHPMPLSEEDERVVREYRERQERLSQALVRFWSWVKDHPDDRTDDERMLCKLDSEMSRAGFPVVDEGITGLGEAFVAVPRDWG